MREETIAVQEGPDREMRRGREVHSIAEVLDELLAQYRAKFPHLKVTVVQTTAAA